MAINTKHLHRCVALILGLFIVTHLGVHLTALDGIETHLSVLKSIQWVYRNPVGETILVAAILSQIVTGASRLRFKARSFWARAQVISGCYLIVFFLIHTSAALMAHHLMGVETDFYWAAGTLQYDPIRWGFAAYYFSAVVAVFVHWAAALHFAWRAAPRAVVVSLPVVGVVVASAIIATFWGAFYTIEIPEATAEYFRQNFGFLGVDP